MINNLHFNKIRNKQHKKRIKYFRALTQDFHFRLNMNNRKFNYKNTEVIRIYLKVKYENKKHPLALGTIQDTQLKKI